MRRIRPELLAVVIAVWLLTDLWRMFTPSLITLFGRAAETPAEVMGAYALAVMACPLLLLAFIKHAAPRLAAWLLVAAFAVRIVLRLNPDGGDVQLYASSLGVALTVAALCLLAASAGPALIPALFLGVAISASTHAALGSFGAVWRSDAYDIVLLVAQAAVLALALWGIRKPPQSSSDRTPTPVSARVGLLLFPSLLIMQLALINVGRGSATLLVWGGATAVLGAWLAVAVTRLPAPTRRPWAEALVLVACVAIAVPLEVTRNSIEGQLSLWALVAFLVGPAALTRLLMFDKAVGTPRRTALMTGVGAVIWTVFLFIFYAGYDLGYRADWVVVALAALISLGALLTPTWATHTTEPRSTGTKPMLAIVSLTAVVSVAAAILAPAVTIRPLSTHTEPSASELTVAAYNLRMGYGIDGTFDQIAVAQQILDSGAQAVLLSEVDRGWLLNGGQDQLAILARLLDMRFVFGPAGDQVWGDVILTSLPIVESSSQKMPKFNSLTGAAMTSATVLWNDTPVQLIATHLQPDADNATLRQAEVFATALSDASAAGPVIGGGDLNTEPGSAAWAALEASGAADALAPARPAFTWSAERPSQQIDHLFVRGFEIVDSGVTQSLFSDHLMVSVTVR